MYYVFLQNINTIWVRLNHINIFLSIPQRWDMNLMFRNFTIATKSLSQQGFS